MAELVREFGEGAIHDELRDAYNHFGVPVMTPAEYPSRRRSELGGRA